MGTMALPNGPAVCRCWLEWPYCWVLGELGPNSYFHHGNENEIENEHERGNAHENEIENELEFEHELEHEFMAKEDDAASAIRPLF